MTAGAALGIVGTVPTTRADGRQLSRRAPSLREATPEELRRACDPSELPFASTAEVEPSPVPAGQALAASALQLATELRGGGFDAFVTGPPGTGKRAAVLAWLHQRARSEPAAPDLVYLPNFADRLRPRAVDVPAGRGDGLVRDVERMVADASRRLADAFEGDRYRARHRELHEELDHRRVELLGRLEARASALGVALQLTPTGVMMAPIVARRPLTPDEIAQMPHDARGRFEAATEQLRGPSEEVFVALRDLERDTAARHEELNREVALDAVAGVSDAARAAWSDTPAILAWLEEVRDDVVTHLGAFRRAEECETGGPGRAPFGLGAQPPRPAERYAVNVVVRNDPDAGAPVVSPEDSSFPALFGRIEYETAFGAVVTDHRHLRGGALHAARGGYLVLDARDVLSAPFVWGRLKEVLRSGRIRIENPGVQYMMFPGVSPEPEPVDARLTTVLVGSHDVYELLHAVDEDVARLFKVRADFDADMVRDASGEQAFGELLSRLAHEDGIPHFEAAAVAELIEHASRLAGHQERLTTRTRELVDVAREAGHGARRDGRDLVGAADVGSALGARRARSGLVERRLHDAIAEGTLQIDLSGTCVGQVNGLAVRAAADAAFGHPVRITATAAPGEGHVVDIEREAELSGPLHAKGVLILAGFLAGRYCADNPLALRASIVFEQSYGPVEGDSASAAELIALLSALADVPIHQSIAITGAIDQHGRIQAIGGVNEKVEGFFRLCRERRLTGAQGVVVPTANLRHAMLDREVVDAVRDGLFHIWPVRSVDQALEVLTAQTAGERGPHGTWARGSLNAAVQDRLSAMSAAAAARSAAPPPGPRS